MDDILLVSSDMNLMHEAKRFLNKNFDTKDLGKHLMAWALKFIDIDLMEFRVYHRDLILISSQIF